MFVPQFCDYMDTDFFPAKVFVLLTGRSLSVGDSTLYCADANTYPQLLPNTHYFIYDDVIKILTIPLLLFATKLLMVIHLRVE